MRKLGIRYSQLSAAVVAVAFVATACSDSGTNSVSQVATTLSVNVGSGGQTGTVALPLALPISVHVGDQNGNAIPNETVSWTITAGGGAIGAQSSVTSATGDALVNWTLGSAAGANTLTASVATGASVTITATAAAGSAALVTLVSGDAQSVTAGMAAQPMVVKVTDQFGNPVANATVTWATTGGGALSASTSTTDANGLAQTTLTTSTATGAFTVSATGPAGSPVMFSGTGM